MTTVTGLTAERMIAIEGASVIDGDVIGDNLILTKHDGSQINAGSVRGPQGVPGPSSADLSVIQARPVLDIGVINQIRAGRQLTASDFTNMGLSIPAGLWNLSDLTDASGNGRALLNKGAVPFDIGINGAATTAAKFSGLTTQALYIPDTGAADPFRIKTGSFGCWVRSPNKAFTIPLGKQGTASGNFGWLIDIDASGMAAIQISTTGTDFPSTHSTISVVDDRWHFIVGTHDGSMLRLYVDGMYDSSTPVNGAIFGSAAPLNVGSIAGDGATASIYGVVGRIDEAFVTADVLTEDQIRNLYCAKIPHTLGVVPTRVTMNVRRRRRNPVLAVADFATQPLRMYNFSAAALADEGSQGVAVVNNGGAVSVGGVDGTPGNAFSFNGTNQYLSSTDANLPLVLADRSYGCWFKTTDRVNTRVIMSWGTNGAGVEQLNVTAGRLNSTISTDGIPGPSVADGLWHHVVVIATNNPLADGSKRRLYLDGQLIGSLTTLISVTPGGANQFRIGCLVTSLSFFQGQIDSVFVCNYVISSEDAFKLYAKGTQTMAPSPKNHGDHVEALTATDVLATFDTLDNITQIDLGVAA